MARDAVGRALKRPRSSASASSRKTIPARVEVSLVLAGGFMGRHKEELKRSDLETQLTEAGREGWELTHVLMEQALQGEKDGHVLIFRREV